MFEVKKCQDLSIYHMAVFRVHPLVDDIVQDLYPSLYTDTVEGRPLYCLLITIA